MLLSPEQIHRLERRDRPVLVDENPVHAERQVLHEEFASLLHEVWRLEAEARMLDRMEWRARRDRRTAQIAG